jgi:molybdenum-dependent DNA-binding transcriptional regulator ModE
MGRKPSISPEQGERLLKAYQRLGNKSAAAREIGVSEDAADRYLKSVPAAAAPVVAQQREIIETTGASLFDSTAALSEHYQGLCKLLRQLDQGIMEERTGKDGPYVTLTPVSTNIAGYREAREYVLAATKLLELMYSVEEHRKFREAVLAGIREADEPTYRRIVAYLREQRSLGFVLTGP